MADVKSDRHKSRKLWVGVAVLVATYASLWTGKLDAGNAADLVAWVYGALAAGTVGEWWARRS